MAAQATAQGYDVALVAELEGDGEIGHIVAPKTAGRAGGGGRQGGGRVRNAEETRAGLLAAGVPQQTGGHEFCAAGAYRRRTFHTRSSGRGMWSGGR